MTYIKQKYGILSFISLNTFCAQENVYPSYMYGIVPCKRLAETIYYCKTKLLLLAFELDEIQ